MGSYDRIKGRVCTKEGKILPLVKGRKRGSEGVHLRTAKEEIYTSIEITSDSTSILCRKKGWEKANGTRL